MTGDCKIDSINDEVVICKYDGQLKENMKELMRIAVVKKMILRISAERVMKL